MAIAIPTQAFFNDLFNRRYRPSQVTSLNSHAILTAGGSLGEASDILAVVIQEVVNTNVGRIQINPTANAAWNVGKGRSDGDFPAANFTIPGGGSNASYDKAWRLYGVGSNAPRLVTNINATSDKLEFLNSVAHGFVNDEPVTVVARAGGTVPPELLSSGQPRVLYVRNQISTLNTEQSIQLSLTAGGAVINFTAGSGNIDVRSLGTAAGGLGIPECYIDYASTQTLSAGGSALSVDLSLASGKSGTDVLSL